MSGLHAQRHLLQLPAQAQAVASQDLRVVFWQDYTRMNRTACGCRGDEEKEPLIRKTGAPEFDATLEPGRTPDKGR